MSSKIFVIETSVLIHNPEALYDFEDNLIVLPMEVIESLDGLKGNDSEAGDSARKALRLIDLEREKGNISKGVSLKNGGTLQVMESGKVNYFPDRNSENRIVSLALDLQKQDGETVVVISKNVAVRIKAEALGLKAEDYKKDKTSVCLKYGRVMEEGDPRCEEIRSLRFVNVGGQIHAVHGDGQERVPVSDQMFMGIKPRNPEQLCAFYALSRPDINIVALTGLPGGGKTLLALAVGLDLTMEKKKYRQVLVARPNVSVGDTLGFEPGSTEEKLEPWMMPIRDNVEVLINTPLDNKGPSSGKQSSGKICKPPSSFESLVMMGQLSLQNIAHIRGRTLPKRYFIVDESQNLKPMIVKTLGTRCGEGTKIVLTGDLAQIDDPYLDAQSNGLTDLIAKLINQENFCFLNFEKSERSALAEQLALLL